jgi:hypothetical protein
MARPKGAKDGYARRRRTKHEIEMIELFPPELVKADLELPLYGLLRRIASADTDIDERYRDFLRVAVLPYLHARATSKLLAKPYFMMTDAELIEVRRQELEHERQIEISRKHMRAIK